MLDGCCCCLRTRPTVHRTRYTAKVIVTHSVPGKVSTREVVLHLVPAVPLWVVHSLGTHGTRLGAQAVLEV